MPNHITSKVRIHGPLDTLKRLRERLWKKDGVEYFLDFDGIVPKTEDVKKSGDDPGYYPEGFLRHWKPHSIWAGCPMPYWYEWRCENWGTKWNSYGGEETTVPESEGDAWEFKILTAWSAPKEIYRALAKQNPDIQIYVKYADEDIGRNCGIITIGAGVDEFVNKDGDFDFAAQVHGYANYKAMQEDEE